MKVIIAAGGSGGHIFPAIALGRALMRLDRSVGIMYVGSDSALDRRIFEKEGASGFATLSSNKLSYKISPMMIPVFFKLLVDIFKALSIILSYKPDVAVGFGGYVSFPVIFAARLFGIHIVVHEQNVSPGRANRMLFGLASKIALSFEDTGKAVGRYAEKCVFTGNPIRTEIAMSGRLNPAGRLGPKESKFTVLVMGGSQGAAFLNKTFIDALLKMDPGARRSMRIIHITGVKDYEKSLRAYEGLGIDYRVHSFIDRIEDLYVLADLVVTRSGSSAIFELACLRKPMILIPYPFAMSHQLENALAFSRKGAAVLIEEKNLDASAFGELISDLMKDSDRMALLGKAAGLLAVPQASDNLAREVMALKRR